MPVLGIQIILNAQPFSATIHTEPILENSNINDYKEDSEGNVWFAGKKLLRYDGAEFVDMGFPNCISNDCYISSIFFDLQGTLWLTGKGIGLNKFVNNQFIKIDGPSDLFYADVFESYEHQVIVADKMGRIYAVMANYSNGYLNHVFWDGNTWSEPDDGAQNNDFEKYLDITIDNGDTVYIRFMFDFEYGLGDDFYYHSYNFSNLGICCNPVDIKPQADGSVLMLINGDVGDFNIVKKSGQTWSLAQTPSTTPNMIPFSLEVDINGRTWVVGFNTANNKLRLGYVEGSQIKFVTAANLGISSFDFNNPYPLATSKNKLWVNFNQGSNTTLCEIHLDGINATHEKGDAKYQFDVFGISPNPSNNESKIQLKLKKSANVSYEILNAFGEVVSAKQVGVQHPDEMKTYGLPKLDSGLYFVKVSADGLFLSRKMLVLN